VFDEAGDVAFVFDDEDAHLLDTARSLPACPVILHGRCVIHGQHGIGGRFRVNDEAVKSLLRNRADANSSVSRRCTLVALALH
jgi:hypothetical protein